MFDGKLLPKSCCSTRIDVRMELYIWVWISLANKFSNFCNHKEWNRIDCRTEHVILNCQNKAWIRWKYTVQDYWTSQCKILSNTHEKFCKTWSFESDELTNLMNKDEWSKKQKKANSWLQKLSELCHFWSEQMPDRRHWISPYNTPWIHYSNIPLASGFLKISVIIFSSLFMKVLFSPGLLILAINLTRISSLTCNRSDWGQFKVICAEALMSPSLRDFTTTWLSAWESHTLQKDTAKREYSKLPKERQPYQLKIHLKTLRQLFPYCQLAILLS